jgi:hypothetical protein
MIGMIGFANLLFHLLFARFSGTTAPARKAAAAATA